ncbi:MAG TPA: tetratricopeptide repeat protein [Caulobacteraceae bacterium]|jgi:tetratricopeptide (TPR) repeat protein
MNQRQAARLGVIFALGLALSGCGIFHHGRPWLAFLAPRGRPELKVRPIPLAAPGALYRPDEGLYRDAASAINQRDYGLALDLLQAARDRDPNDPRVFNALGVVYDKLGRFDLAEDFYAQAEALDPGSPILANNRAYSRLLQGKSAAPALASGGPPRQAAPVESCSASSGQAICNATGGTSW